MIYVEGGTLPEKLGPFRLETEAEVVNAKKWGVFSTADTFAVCERKMVLAWRKIEPMGNRWWRFGSQRAVGETPAQAAARTFRAETSIEQKPEDFISLSGPDDWVMLVHHDLGDFWRHDSCYNLGLVITPEELQRFQLSPRKYDLEKGIVLWSLEEVMRKVREGKLHEHFGDIAGIMRANGLL